MFPPCHISSYLLVLSDFSSRSQTKPQHEFILGRFELNRSFLLRSAVRRVKIVARPDGEGRLAFVTRNRQLLHPLLCGLNFFHTLAYSPLVARWSPLPSGLSHFASSPLGLNRLPGWSVAPRCTLLSFFAKTILFQNKRRDGFEEEGSEGGNCFPTNVKQGWRWKEPW